jgi:hypothetical protein
MTSYIGAAWRLNRATMSISTMGAIAAAGGYNSSPIPADQIARTNAFRYLNTRFPTL